MQMEWDRQGEPWTWTPRGATALRTLPFWASPFKMTCLQGGLASSPSWSTLSSSPLRNHFYYFMILVYSSIVPI